MDTEPDGEWFVACLCAAWCGSCRDYRATFEAFARAHGDCCFAWVDIEDHADALAPFDPDIDDFPTVLIASGDALHFFGALTPQPGTLAQTLAAARRSVLVRAPGPDAAALVACLRQIGERLA